MSNQKWTDEQIQYVINEREGGKTFIEISQSFNKKYKEACSDNLIKKTYYRYRDADLESADVIKSMKVAYRAAKAKGQVLKENKLLLENMMSKEEFLRVFKETLIEYPIKLHKPVNGKRNKVKIKRALVMHCSDTHFQSAIDSGELGGLNKYGNIEEARRLAFFVKEVANYKLHYRNETELVFVLNGDIFQGVLRNQESTPLLTTQISATLHLLTQAISYLSTKFGKVKVVCLTDNHGRQQHKMDKGRSTSQKWDSYTTIMHVALRYALTSYKNVSFSLPETPYAYFDLLGHKFFVTHSDTVISSGNVGVSVSSKNIKDKINDLVVALGPIDVVMLGHVHVPLRTLLNNGTELIVNGTASGIDPYAQSLGILKNLPTQQLFEVTEEHAVGDTRFVRLEKADTMEELDKIITPFVGKF